MTADAKIGTLLGLMFLVIIAFLLNGRPNFFKSDESKADQIVVDIPEPEPTENIRIPLAFNDTVLAHSTVPLRSSTPSETEESFAVPDTAQQTTADQPDEPQETTTPRPTETTYIVKSGDTLADIAKEHYGAELGNKKATIKAIAKANQLASEHMIFAGDELIMPSLTPDKATPAKASVTVVQMISENIRNTFGERFTKKKTVEYVVKSGDCLSRIASEQLGTCKRVDEIIKLNKDLIKDADDIFKGMVIVLPKS